MREGGIPGYYAGSVIGMVAGNGYIEDPLAMAREHVLGNESQMERMRRMGRNVADALAAETEEKRVKWRGDTYLFPLPGNTMGYAVNSGRLAAERAADYIFTL